MYMNMNDWPFGWANSTMEIPEGYELVEKPEYKKEKLKKEIDLLERHMEYHRIRGIVLGDKLKEAKKELKDLEKTE